jgi:MFS transporter, ACS family, hexuronate transporter
VSNGGPATRQARRRAIPGLRWWIGGILFASTAINYIDRQSLSLLAPYLKQKGWTDTDYANIVVAFRVAYSIGQAFCGRLMDRLGTKRGLSLTVLWYSIVSMLTPVARGFYSFLGLRFLLGIGESGNWPGATKAVSEWFPGRERALAAALFDSGSSIGAAVAPFLVLPLYYRWGMGPAFLVPGLLGIVWLTVWRFAYQLPINHPRISEAELRMITSESGSAHGEGKILQWRQLLQLPQTWGTIVARAFTDPVFFFIADWFPIYLVAKGVPLRSGLIALWVPFIGTDAGNFVGGWLSGHLVKRGLLIGAARKSIIVAGSIGMMLLIPTIFTASLPLLTLLFSLACFSYGMYTTMANVLPSDVFFSESVASVSGLSGSGAAICTIVVSELAGHLGDARQAMGTHVFDPLILLSGVIPFVGMILVLFLVRNTPATERGLVRRI